MADSKPEVLNLLTEQQWQILSFIKRNGLVMQDDIDFPNIDTDDTDEGIDFLLSIGFVGARKQNKRELVCERTLFLTSSGATVIDWYEHINHMCAVLDFLLKKAMSSKDKPKKPRKKGGRNDG